MIRLYWLGRATEPGDWAIDTGPGTRRLRIDGMAASGVTMVYDRSGDVKPRAFLAAIAIDWISAPGHSRRVLPTLEDVRDFIDTHGVDQSPE